MLTTTTVESLLRTLNLEFNLWDADPRDGQVVGLWQARLRRSGLTDENATRLIGAFCASWTGRRPTLHDVAGYVRDRIAGVAKPRERPPMYSTRPDGTQIKVKPDPWREERNG